MTDSRTILAIDQGTTSTRAILFDARGHGFMSAQEELPQIYPLSGWVEHDPEQIWQATLNVCHNVLQGRKAPAAIGITNQRETVVVWDRKTGRAIHNALVWQDRRTAKTCRDLIEAGHEKTITDKTGLVIDPYFSATKIAWLLDHVEGARKKAESGDLAFGTIDCFLLWRLTEGRMHATDASNASRTLLFNIHTQRWDSELCSLLRVPESMLPLVMDNVADFGETRLFGGPIPVCGMAGDQQAATVGQACFSPGEAKSTYGTGCFLVLNTGSIPVPSTNKLLTTVAWRLNGNVTYALEGSIFSAGSAVQWLRDGLKLIEKAPESENIARSISSTDGVYLVPAFTGLGAPYWDPHARGGVFGITRDTGVAHLVRAALESVCYQTRDLLDAMGKDRNEPLALLKVDGGMVGNDWLLQYLADICAVEVDRPAVIETTALGAAYLAGLGCGIYDSLDEIAALWRANGHFKPSMSASMRAERLEGWHRAVVRVLD